ETSTDIPQFFSDSRIIRTAHTCVTGRVTFRPAMVKEAFREARLLTLFFRAFKIRRIWRELIARPLLTPIWRLSFELAPASQKLVRSVDCDHRETNVGVNAQC